MFKKKPVHKEVHKPEVHKPIHRREADIELPENEPIQAQPEKTDLQCVEEGCFELKAPGQTHVCSKHMRT